MPAGTANPDNSCQHCDPSANPNDWSPVADGTGCVAGQICFAGQCQSGCDINGSFVPTGIVIGNACLACDPNTSTTALQARARYTSCGSPTDLCDGDGGCAAGCLISNQPYLAGEQDPNTVCQVCQPATSNSAFSPAGAGAHCLGGGLCNASGACIYDCLIDGGAFLLGAANPDNACQVCGAQANVWAELVSGTACGAAQVCVGVPGAVQCQCGTPVEDSVTAYCMGLDGGAFGDCATALPNGGPAQDGLVLGNVPVLHVESGGLVYDSVSGLEWQANGTTANAPVIQPDGSDVCSALPADGGASWHLARVHELMTVIDYGANAALGAPFVHPQPLVWTGDLSATNGNPIQVEIGTGGLILSTFTTSATAFCVRPAAGSCTAQGFAPTDAGLALDERTGLTWLTAALPGESWGAAIETCAAYDATAQGSYASGWRLPTLKELAGVLQYGATSSPLLDPVLTPDPNDAFEWTSTPRVLSVNQMAAWSIDTDTGFITFLPTPPKADGGITTVPFRCVH